MAAEIREENGIKYVYADYRGIQESEDMMRVLNEGVELMKNNPSVNHLLSNFTGTHLFSEFIEKVKSAGKEKRVKTALVGISKMMSFITNAISTVTRYDTKCFKNEKEALKWLVE